MRRIYREIKDSLHLGAFRHRSLIEERKPFRVLHVRLGGTIESVKSSAGNVVSNVLSRKVMQGIADEHDIKIYQTFVLDERREKIFKDSTDISPSDWSRIAIALSKRISNVDHDLYWLPLDTESQHFYHYNYNAVIITHGSDTMAYTAAALTFMMHRLSIPVILTGSMKEFDAVNTDAYRNISNALKAAKLLTPGVYVVFGDKIILGSRASKVTNASDNAFDSINEQLVGKISSRRLKINRIFTKDYFPPFGSKKPRPYYRGKVDHFYLRAALSRFGEDVVKAPFSRFASEVVKVSCAPGSFLGNLEWVRQLNLPLIIEAFGDGNIPKTLRSVAASLISTEVPVLVCSDVRYGKVNLFHYAASLPNAIPSSTMTKETAYVKFIWLLGHTRDYQTIRNLMTADFAGEMGVNTINDDWNDRIRFASYQRALELLDVLNDGTKSVTDYSFLISIIKNTEIADIGRAAAIEVIRYMKAYQCIGELTRLSFFDEKVAVRAAASQAADEMLRDLENVHKLDKKTLAKLHSDSKRVEREYILKFGRRKFNAAKNEIRFLSKLGSEYFTEPESETSDPGKSERLNIRQIFSEVELGLDSSYALLDFLLSNPGLICLNQDWLYAPSNTYASAYSLAFRYYEQRTVDYLKSVAFSRGAEFKSRVRALGFLLSVNHPHIFTALSTSIFFMERNFSSAKYAFKDARLWLKNKFRREYEVDL